jgi:hypothetical protein
MHVAASEHMVPRPFHLGKTSLDLYGDTMCGILQGQQQPNDEHCMWNALYLEDGIRQADVMCLKPKHYSRVHQ